MSVIPTYRLFKPVKNPYASVDDALKEIGGDFEVRLQPAFIEDMIDDGKPVKIPGMSATVRTDTGEPLGGVGDRYGIVQYRTYLDFLNDVIENRQAEMYCGQVTDNGARLHLIVKVPNYVELGAGERFEAFFVITATHDGSGCLQLMCAPVHNVSQTIFTPTGDGVVKIKHSARVEQRLATARRTFRKLNDYFKEFSEYTKEMCGIQLSDQMARDYFLSVVPDPKGGDNTRAKNIREKLDTIYKTGLTHQLGSCRGTLFGCFMAVQQYADYYKTVRKAIRRNEMEAKLEARLCGNAAKLKAESFVMALALMDKFGK